MLNGRTILWASKKQIFVALSTIEEEFVTSISAVHEGVRLRRFLQHLGIVTTLLPPGLYFVTIRLHLLIQRISNIIAKRNTLISNATFSETLFS